MGRRELNKRIGDNIVQARKAVDVSQRVLAEWLYITQPTLSKYERGVRQPDLETLIRIAELLNTTLDKLVY